MQAPLDLRGVYGDSNDWWVQGTLTLTNWTDDSNDPKWTLEGTSDVNTTKLAFITDNDYITLAFYNATFIRHTLMVFDKLVTYFDGCTFKNANANGYCDFIFGQGWHEFRDITLDNSVKMPLLQGFGTNCFFNVRSDITFTQGIPDNQAYTFRMGKGVIFQVDRLHHNRHLHNIMESKRLCNQ